MSMFRVLGSLVIAAGLFAAACGSTPPVAPAAATAVPSATSTAAAAAVTATATGTAGGAATPGANAATRVTGTVQTIDASEITLTNGTTFALTSDARVIVQRVITSADLKPGQFVAVTAKRQPDNTLLASIVSVFSDSLSKTIPAGQRPLPEGNLMTNASIGELKGNSFTVTFTGGGANVTLAPDAQLLQQTDATIGDLKIGATISAGVTDGTARSVTIQR
jgi:hypothetical protein